MKPAILTIIGATIFGLTYGAWWFLNAFACGMNPTGCNGFTLAWHDWEALQFFVPAFVIGAVMFAYGLWKVVRRRLDGEDGQIESDRPGKCRGHDRRIDFF